MHYALSNETPNEFYANFYSTILLIRINVSSTCIDHNHH